MCKLFAALLLIFLTLSSFATKANLHNFVTDKCTLFVEGPPTSPRLWEECCLIHDLRYWYGGSILDQDLADLKLKSCVEKKAGTFWANLIYNGVRAGHYSPIKHKYQWSWGWINKRDNSTLSESENELVKSELLRLDYPKDFLDNFIKDNFQK